MMNAAKLDVEANWFLSYHEKVLAGQDTDVLVDPFEVLPQRFSGAERALLFELCEELRSKGPWAPTAIYAS